jgi:hypothetical protein
MTGHSVRASVFVEWDSQSATADGTTKVWPLNGSTTGWRQPLTIGHRHLSRLLLVHDVLSRQGVATASGMLSQSEIAGAIDACGYFDLHDLAAVVAEIPLAGSTPLSAQVFDDEYHRRYGSTNRVVDAILEQLASRPFDFPGGTV